MSRTALIGLVVAAIVIGIPVVVVLAAGGDDEPASPTSAQGATVPADERGGGPPARNDQGRPEKSSGGPPADKVVYDGPPPKPRGIEAELEGVGYPSALTPAGVPAATIVERRLGRETEEGQPTVIAADCRKGTCTLRIRSEPRGTGRIIDDQAVAMRGLFADRGIRTVVVYVHHALKGRGKNERPAFIKITCRRARHPGFRWSSLTPRQLARRCVVKEEAGGQLRNHVRRGKLTNEQASRNVKGGSGGGAGSRQKPIRMTAEERRAQREEMEDLRRQREAEQKRQVQSEQEAGRAG